MAEPETAEKIKKALAPPVIYKFKHKDEVPEMKTEKDKKLKIFKWGANNLAPDFLISLGQTRSATHSAILQRKTRMIAGNGWEEPTTKEGREFLANIRGSHHLDDLALLNASDNEFLNHFALIVRWNKDKTNIGAIDFVPAGKVRIGLKKDQFWISNDWKNHKKQENKPRELTEFSRKLPRNFDTLKPAEKKMHLNQIIFAKEMQIGTDTYSKPTYAAGMNWILADAAIASFTLNMVKKNFAGGYHINIATGIPDADERKDFKDNFVGQYGGEEGNSIVITFSDGEEEAPNFNALPSTGNENIYNETEKRASENIFKVHEVTNPQLFGVRVPGELGGRSELQESLEIQQAVYTDQRQEAVEKVYNRLAKINGVTEELKLKKYTIAQVMEEVDEVTAQGNKNAEALKKLTPIAQAKVLENLTPQEIRGLIAISTEDDFVPPKKDQGFSRDFMDQLVEKLMMQKQKEDGNNP